MDRIKQNVLILVPLIISSFERVGNISNAMDLRGYGRGKTRTYYCEHEEGKADKIFKAIYTGPCSSAHSGLYPGLYTRRLLRCGTPFHEI